MCGAGFCGPEGHGSLFTADSFYVHSTPTPEYLAIQSMCQKDKSVFHLFEMHYSQRSPTWSLDLTVWQKRVHAANTGTPKFSVLGYLSRLHHDTTATSTFSQCDRTDSNILIKTFPAQKLQSLLLCLCRWSDQIKHIICSILKGKSVYSAPISVNDTFQMPLSNSGSIHHSSKTALTLCSKVPHKMFP